MNAPPVGPRPIFEPVGSPVQFTLHPYAPLPDDVRGRIVDALAREFVPGESTTKHNQWWFEQGKHVATLAISEDEIKQIERAGVLLSINAETGAFTLMQLALRLRTYKTDFPDKPPSQS